MDRAADPAAVRPAAAARGPWWRPARTSPATLVAGTVLALLVVGAVLAPWLAPHRPYDLASLDLAQSLRPPIGAPGSDWRHPLGTDEQGRDLLSGLLYGLFGYLWIRGRFDPTFPLRLRGSVVIMLLGWFVVCAVGLIPHIANWAHGIGLALGMLWGYLESGHLARKLR